MRDDNKTALVIGATGGIGGEVAAGLIARGWQVRALTRDVAGARRRAPDGAISWFAGDAMNRVDVAAAAVGVSLIVHAANPPGYRDWDKLALPMLDNSIAAARETGARILFPGTIYNYGPDAFPVLREDSPQRPRTRKGAIRVEMERRLRDAGGGRCTRADRARRRFLRTARRQQLVWARAGEARQSPSASVSYPGTLRVGHAWAYLPDLAEAMLRLVERGDALGPFATFSFPRPLGRRRRRDDRRHPPRNRAGRSAGAPFSLDRRYAGRALRDAVPGDARECVISGASRCNSTTRVSLPRSAPSRIRCSTAPCGGRLKNWAAWTPARRRAAAFRRLPDCRRRPVRPWPAARASYTCRARVRRPPAACACRPRRSKRFCALAATSTAYFVGITTTPSSSATTASPRLDVDAGADHRNVDGAERRLHRALGRDRPRPHREAHLLERLHVAAAGVDDEPDHAARDQRGRQAIRRTCRR